MNNSDLKRSKCKIVVDAMGGDFAPQNTVTGAIQAFHQKKDFELFFVGKKPEIEEVISRNKLSFDPWNIIHTDQVIGMEELPTNAIKGKPESSLVVGTRLVKEKKADAFVSAGNTGAVMAASTLIMGRLPGVGRPTIGAEMPSIGRTCYLYDVGAGKDSRPQHLFEYAIMGSIFASEMGGVKNPSVGLLNMGEEESKGNELTLSAYNILKNSDLNFIGNVEGRDILTGKADVVVCDGFLGNILLKFGESVPALLKYLMKKLADKSFIDKIKIGLVTNTLRKALKVMDYQEHGGVPLLGVDGICIIGHGSSSSLAVRNMVLKANEMHHKNLVNKIELSIKKYSAHLNKNGEK